MIEYNIIHIHCNDLYGNTPAPWFMKFIILVDPLLVIITVQFVWLFYAWE